ncbi:MAG: BamA/TamA family outer membrane protein [Candidatus Margulisbacteria bacterium]|nr:BamA/TamA family outer membrane protein [Candidatus Margulisiibacteriota bacterium]MBU1021763.1 BamA/TamA family outer membrane protein [Candidatus Margulisiibacteriota bacterium]MBU1729509.1 BamA/TamA family outer membrane protein [Candidatus Margulisiibacteriota bacterium]MBU1955390.1 BamA/TamA family outer membrane protein [Candidatus Margulisiibacteriota bacterium]
MKINPKKCVKSLLLIVFGCLLLVHSPLLALDDKDADPLAGERNQEIDLGLEKIKLDTPKKATPAPADTYRRFKAEDETEKVKAKITDIELQGNYFVPDKTIKDAIFSRVGETVSNPKIKADLKAIYSLGYFSDVTVEFEDYKDGTRVIYKIFENPVIRTITIHGNTVISTREIRSNMQTQTGKIINFKFLQSDINRINQLYKEKGYALARVANVDTDAKNHTLHVYIIEGIVESIVLEGNKNTQDYVILRELSIKPGSVFNEKLLAKDLKTVFNLGYFSEINPVFEPGSTKDKIIIVLKIKETRTSTINFGGGFGEAEGWFGFIDFSVNNLFGTARNMLIRGQSGQELQTYQFKYSDPWFLPDQLGDHTGFAFRRWYTVGTDIYLADEDKIRNGWDASITKPLRENLNITYTLGSEKVDPYGTTTFESYLQDTIGVSFSYDTRDFWLNPHSGALYTLALKEGWKYTSYTSGFFKATMDLNQYIPIVEGQTFATHLGVGSGFGDVPEGELYWAGGANTIRGYYPSEAKTGRRKVILNLEYRNTFNEIFQGVLFFDTGNAWNDGFIVTSDFISGWGPGVRLTTPLGPIRLDYGIPSGRTLGEGIIHFSIGQAF